MAIEALAAMLADPLFKSHLAIERLAGTERECAIAQRNQLIDADRWARESDDPAPMHAEFFRRLRDLEDALPAVGHDDAQAARVWAQIEVVEAILVALDDLLAADDGYLPII